MRVGLLAQGLAHGRIGALGAQRSLSDSIKLRLDGCNRVPRDLGTWSQVLLREQGYLDEQSCSVGLDSK